MREFKNYMFFANLEQIKRDIERLMSLDKKKIDDIITNGHDWAGEHVTTAKDDIEEVTNFFLGSFNDNKPYIEEKQNSDVIKRTFSKSVNENELEWHRDKEDRIVIPINENDWYIQFDNELPKKLNLNEEFFIPKNTFHRVIKGKSDLVVEIFKTTFDDLEVYEVIEEGKKKKKKKDACYYKVKSRYDVWPSAYSSGALVKCRKVGAANWGNKSDESVNEKTDYSKEKDKGLHGWFERQGGSGKSSGWVDCNTCKKDPETGRKKCKPCGREDGEDRAKYPACRPTPSACSTKGKGKKWGKKSKKNENLQESEKMSNFVENNFMENIIRAELYNANEEMLNTPETAPTPVKPMIKPESPKRKRIWEVKPIAKPKFKTGE